jgi:hypothetical protein
VARLARPSNPLLGVRSPVLLAAEVCHVASVAEPSITDVICVIDAPGLERRVFVVR